MIDLGLLALTTANGMVLRDARTKKQLDGIIKEGISIIIPAYNEAQFITSALVSIENAKTVYPDTIETIIIDNGSTDNTSIVASSYADQLLTISKGKLNALHAGIMAAQNDIIITLDADITFTPEIIEKIAYHFRNPSLVLLTFHVHQANAPPIFQTYKYLVEEAGFLIYKYGAGTARAFRKWAYIEAGGCNFNADQNDFNSMLWEDEIGLHQRIAKLGETRYDPSIVVYHIERRGLCAECPHGAPYEICIYCQEQAQGERF